MVYFLSDAHLGSRAIENGQVHQQRVVDLLRYMGNDATEIYLLGDMFDFWYEYLWRDRSKEQFEPFLTCLRELTDKGVKVHYFIGNHDIWTFGKLAKRTGVIVHKEPYSAVINSKKIYMAHGDGLIPQWLTADDAQCTMSKEDKKRIRAFMRLRAFFHHPVPQFLYRLLPPCIGNGFGYEWARRSRMKELAHPCPYKGEKEEELVLFSKEQPQQDYFIFGHRHIELDLMIRKDSRVIILGDLFKLWTYAQMDDKGDIQLCTAEKNN